MLRKSAKAGKATKSARTTQSLVRPIPDHTCELPLQEEIVTYTIYHSLCVLLRRRLWKWVTVSSYSPDSKKYLKSAARIYDEEVRHLRMHPNMIHPFSSFRFCWEMFMLCTWGVQFAIIPLTISVEQHSEVFFYVYSGICVLCNVDVVMWFFTGYFDARKQMVVLKPQKVAKHYIFTFFVVDFVTSQPLCLYFDFFFAEVYQFSCYVLLIKLVRLPTLLSYLQKLGERTGFAISHVRLITFTIWILVLLGWVSSIAYALVSYFHPVSLAQTAIAGFPLLMTAFKVTRALMVVGVTDIINSTNLVMIVEIGCITVGSVLQIIILAKVMQFYQKRSSSRNKYNHLLEEIGEYMKYKELPHRLRDKILRYIDFKFQKHIFREEDVLNNLSPVLKHDILIQRCQTMIEKVDFFKDLPPSVMVRIVTKLRSEIYLPSDIIVMAGYTGNAMYFIYVGTVAVYTGGGKEICHLDDGGHFGEITLLINAPRVATVVAVKECELFRLSRRDFQEAIEPYPELNKKIRRLAMSRLESTLQMMSQENEGVQTLKRSDRSYSVY